MNTRTLLFKAFFVLALPLLLVGCSASRFVPEGEHLLDRVSMRADSAHFSVSQLDGFVRQRPNARWFSSLKVPLGIYCLSGKNDRKWVNKMVRRLGEAPVIYDREQALKTLDNLQNAVRNMGYLNADVDLYERTVKHKMQTRYQIQLGDRYFVRHVDWDIQDTAVARVMKEQGYTITLPEKMPFDAGLLDAERNRLHNFLVNQGFYEFNKSYIYFEADTLVGNHQVDIHMVLTPAYDGASQSWHPHRIFHIGDVSYDLQGDDSIPFLREAVRVTSTELHTGDIYREQDVQKTYERFMRLAAVQSTNVHLRQAPGDSAKLDATISLIPAKPNGLSLNVEGTNSAGDLGAAVSGDYVSRNLFRGSEQLSIKMRVAYEAIRGLKGYENENYLEIGGQVSLLFPDFKFPFLSRNLRRKLKASTELSINYDSQNRPEFHRRVLSGSWRYRWQQKGGMQQHRADLLDLNYVFMPWISKTFYDQYLANPTSRNAILRYNYENLFIMKWGYSFTYSSLGKSSKGSNYGTNAYVIRTSVETAGNLLYGLTTAMNSQRNSEGQYTLFNIAYAQYAKMDFDFSKSFRINERNSIALHFGLGMALPYGNSSILPFEKRYFSGGANSVRGWSVRGLGPGKFRGTDGRIDFINQTGDIKLDMNFEYRSHLFWKLDGAAFIDAGNIWTFRDYDEQPGGQFRFDSFYKQIAVAYGLGVRLNFSYFIVRLDLGMKAVNPAYDDRRHHYPLLYPNFNRDATFHFAVGLPF